MNYYNDNDPAKCAWARELIQNGLAPAGEVDPRPIQEIAPDELKGFAQCHFFAGILGWPYALQLAGWPADRPVWTGSCPCQPFSCAGKRRAEDDPRHLWPAFLRLITECRPPVVFGEQVASKAGREWLAGVRADLEALGYAVGAADLCAAGVGAPQIRQRLWWVADSKSERNRGNSGQVGTPTQRLSEWKEPLQSGGAAKCGCEDGRMARAEDTDRRGGERGTQEGAWPDGIGRERLGGRCENGGVVSSNGRRRDGRSHEPERGSDRGGTVDRPGPWSEYDLIPCRDGKGRRIEPGLEPLVDGLPGRVGLLRGYGDAIVSQVAATFIECYLADRLGRA